VRLRPLAFFLALLSLVSCYSPSNAQKKKKNSSNYKGFGKKASGDEPNPTAFVSTAAAGGDPAAAAAADVSAAAEWERQNLEPFALKLTGSDGTRGIRARKDRAAGDILLEIPLGETITADRIRSRLASCSPTDGDNDGDDEEEALALGLLRLRDETADSYASSVLPREHFSVWTLPEDLWEEVAAILPRCYAETFGATRRRIHEFATRIADTRGVARNDALWAFSMVRSRSFAAPELAGDDAGAADKPPLALLPGLDLLNHAFGATTQLQLVVGDDNDESSSRWVVTSPDPIGEGEELFWSYGDDKDNWKLLLIYGFALPDNPNAVVFWSWQDLLEAAHAVRPDTFSDPVVRQLLRHPQLQVYTVSSEDRATFSYDARTATPRESLANGLAMLANLASQLGKPEREDGVLALQVLEALRKRRLEELGDGRDRLRERNRTGGEEWDPWFDALGVALDSERRQLEEAHA